MRHNIALTITLGILLAACSTATPEATPTSLPTLPPKPTNTPPPTATMAVPPPDPVKVEAREFEKSQMIEELEETQKTLEDYSQKLENTLEECCPEHSPTD